MFRVLSRRVKAARILDLGSGCGTIGIESISRGAMLVTFVDRSARMCSLIRKNLAEFDIRDGHGEVVEMEILPFLTRVARRKRCWDLVYLEIPHGSEHASILERISRGICLPVGGVLLLHHPSDIPYAESISRLKRRRTIEQDKTIVSVYERI